jgi:two-component system cell cycle sensor histidine kinase/response regulator CckA
VPEIASPSPATRGILIVDDQLAIRSLLRLSFSAAGYHVRTASDGVEAMELCESESFHAVLSDVCMPRMDGHELARWHAVRHPAIPFILMTGWDPDCVDCAIAGRCRIVKKPFLPQDVVSLVDSILVNTNITSLAATSITATT